MSKPKFYLDKPNSNSSYIILSYHFNAKRLYYSTGISIPPKFWNKEKQTVLKTAKFPQHTDINNNLSKLAGLTESIHLQFKNKDHRPSVKEFKKELDIATQKTSRDTPRTLFEFIDTLIKEREKLSDEYNAKTLAQYRVVRDILKNYSKSKRTSLDFQDITLEFYNNFLEYLNNTMGFSINYTGNIIKNLKTFLNAATEKGVNKNLAFRSKYFKKPTEETDSIYLTVQELTEIFNTQLPSEKLENVRDCFIIGCFTGLRFSDFSRLTKKNIQTIYNSNGKPVEVISITTQKTDTPVKIPFHPFVRAILNKSNGIPPKAFSNQKMNDYLKEVAKLAGLTEKVQLKKGRIIKTFEKWEKVTTHTARRSFATNAYKAGIPSISIMKITGHKTEKAFLKYIKITEEENAIILANNSFFKTTPLSIAKY